MPLFENLTLLKELLMGSSATELSQIGAVAGLLSALVAVVAGIAALSAA